MSRIYNETEHEPLPSDRPSHAPVAPDSVRLSDLVRASVGETDVVALTEQVKEIMLKEALTRSTGNISGASQLLGISRQGVQQMIQRYGLKDFTADLRKR